MADVTLTYKGNTIAELSDSGSKTIQTAGKYCEDDIGLTYVSPGGGGAVLPSFMNHLESGTFTVESGTDKNIELSGISLPKGIIIFSNGFDLTSAKADKPLLGAYAAFYVAGSDVLTPGSNYYVNLAYYTMYAVNWGQNTNNMNPVWRNSRTESRGIRGFYTNTKKIYMNGFGTGEYDFQYNVEYKWIAWD